jgi:hypothetical protein
MRPELFKQMLDRAKEHGNQFNVDALAEHFHNRYADSKSRNPKYVRLWSFYQTDLTWCI